MTILHLLDSILWQSVWNEIVLSLTAVTGRSCASYYAWTMYIVVPVHTLNMMYSVGGVEYSGCSAALCHDGHDAFCKLKINSIGTND